jgi:selenocysteine lyase/cysteine desulfurase
MAIGEALSFHHGIGGKRKEERLRYLRNYWSKILEKLPGVQILTSYDPLQSCGIGTFTVEDMDMEKLNQLLFDKHKIYTTTIQIPDEIMGIRVTPSIYTTLRELNMFVETVSHYIKQGLPG